MALSSSNFNIMMTCPLHITDNQSSMFVLILLYIEIAMMYVK